MSKETQRPSKRQRTTSEPAMDTSLKGKVAYITGASSGIGLKLVLYFLSKGAAVVAVDADRNMKSNIWQAIPPELHQAENIRNRLAAEIIDVTNWDDQVSGFLFAIAAFGKVDYVIPCAGVGERRWLPPVVAGQAGDFVKPDLKVVDVDLKGVLYTIALAVQQFARQGVDVHGVRGQVILISSICGIYTIPNFPIYTAAKHALVGLTRSYAPSLLQSGVLINAICPAVVRTNISTSDFYDKIDQMGLMTQMETLVAVVERLLTDHESTGNLYECGPDGVKVRGADEVEYADEKTELLCQLLEERAQGSFDITSG